MLQNEFLDAKIGVNPAENEPSKMSLIPAQYLGSISRLLGEVMQGCSAGVRGALAVEEVTRARKSSRKRLLDRKCVFRY